MTYNDKLSIAISELKGLVSILEDDLDLKDRISVTKKVIKELEENQENIRLVEKFIRPDDGEIFSLNEDLTTYSDLILKQQFPEHLHMKWTRNQLLDSGMQELKEEGS